MSTISSSNQYEFKPAAFEIVAIATSAGGLNALSTVLGGLPANFPAAIVVVQHLAPHHRSHLVKILSRRTSLRVQPANMDDRLQAGTVYIAPPDRHLLVKPDRTLALTQTELVNFVRPAADLLFDSVATSHQTRAIAIVLTGTGRDGSMGIKTIKAMGGTVIVEDINTAAFSGMPLTAIKTGAVDFVLPLSDIAPALLTLVAPKDSP